MPDDVRGINKLSDILRTYLNNNNKMKKLLPVLLLFTLVSCSNQNSNPKNSDEIKETETNKETDELSPSKYFKIAKINKARFYQDNEKKGRFEIDFDIINKSNYSFSSHDLNVDIICKAKGTEDWNVLPIPVFTDKRGWKETEGYKGKFWEPNSIINLHFNTEYTQMGNFTFTWTPKEVYLDLSMSAVSVDVNFYNKKFTKINILDEWKQEQVIEGLRK